MKIDPSKGYKLLTLNSVIPRNAEYYLDFVNSKSRWAKTKDAGKIHNSRDMIYRVPVNNNITINEDGSYVEQQ